MPVRRRWRTRMPSRTRLSRHTKRMCHSSSLCPLLSKLHRSAPLTGWPTPHSISTFDSWKCWLSLEALPASGTRNRHSKRSGCFTIDSIQSQLSFRELWWLKRRCIWKEMPRAWRIWRSKRRRTSTQRARRDTSRCTLLASHLSQSHTTSTLQVSLLTGVKAEPTPHL